MNNDQALVYSDYMPRKPIIRSNEHFYHVTARSNNKEDFHIPKQVMWRLLTHQISKIQSELSLKIGGLVLMDNHFHLLVLTPKEDIDRIMYFLMKRLTKSIQMESGRINKIFGGRYKGSLIESHRYLLNVYKYIYRNPIAAGITLRAEDYEFSTLHYYIYKKILPFELEILFLDIGLNWINNSFESLEAESIKFGLQRTIFEFKRDKITKKLIIPA